MSATTDARRPSTASSSATATELAHRFEYMLPTRSCHQSFAGKYQLKTIVTLALPPGGTTTDAASAPTTTHAAQPVAAAAQPLFFPDFFK